MVDPAFLAEAGWVVRDMKLVNQQTGEPMRFEILLVSPEFERIVLPFVRNLKRLGIDARVRLVDQSQYINRLRSFDYDMFVFVWGQGDSPGNEERDYWSCAAADAPGSDSIEIWGRRIGRTVSAIAFLALAVYLYVTYVR